MDQMWQSAVLLNFQFIKEFWKNVPRFPQNIKQSITIFIIDRMHMISEGSCDIEDWSNDAENSALPITGINYNRKHLF